MKEQAKSDGGHLRMSESEGGKNMKMDIYCLFCDSDHSPISEEALKGKNIMIILHTHE